MPPNVRAAAYDPRAPRPQWARFRYPVHANGTAFVVWTDRALSEGERRAMLAPAPTPRAPVAPRSSPSRTTRPALPARPTANGDPYGDPADDHGRYGRPIVMSQSDAVRAMKAAQVPLRPETPAQRRARVEREERMSVFHELREKGYTVGEAIEETTNRAEMIRRRADRRLATGTPNPDRRAVSPRRTRPGEPYVYDGSRLFSTPSVSGIRAGEMAGHPDDGPARAQAEIEERRRLERIRQLHADGRRYGDPEMTWQRARELERRDGATASARYRRAQDLRFRSTNPSYEGSDRASRDSASAFGTTYAPDDSRRRLLGIHRTPDRLRMMSHGLDQFIGGLADWLISNGQNSRDLMAALPPGDRKIGRELYTKGLSDTVKQLPSIVAAIGPATHLGEAWTGSQMNATTLMGKSVEPALVMATSDDPQEREEALRTIGANVTTNFTDAAKIGAAKGLDASLTKGERSMTGLLQGARRGIVTGLREAASFRDPEMSFYADDLLRLRPRWGGRPSRPSFPHPVPTPGLELLGPLPPGFEYTGRWHSSGRPILRAKASVTGTVYPDGFEPTGRRDSRGKPIVRVKARSTGGER